MKTLKLLGTVPLVLLAATAFPQGDNRAVPRGGGGGGGSSAGSRHTGGGGGGGGSSSHSSPSGGGSSASSSSGGRSYSAPGAVGRRPRPGSGTGTRDYYGNEYNHYGYYGGYGGYYGGYYGYPYYGYGYGYPYSYYYGPYAYWGYPGYSYGIGFNYYGGYPYGGYAQTNYYGGGGGGGGTYESSSGAVAQVRTLVDPARTHVYVDGRHAGTADDFDGMFQRLNISPGKHEIELKLEGYATHTYTVYAAPEETLKLRWDMVKGGGDTKEIIGEEYARRVEGDRDQERARERERELAREAERDRQSAPSREVDSSRPPEGPAIMAPSPGQGEVFFEIQPSDASVYIDGEFRGKASQLTRLLLPSGRHRVEVVRPGFRTTETVITIEGEAKKLVIKLDR